MKCHLTWTRWIFQKNISSQPRPSPFPRKLDASLEHPLSAPSNNHFSISHVAKKGDAEIGSRGLTSKCLSLPLRVAQDMTTLGPNGAFDSHFLLCALGEFPWGNKQKRPLLSLQPHRKETNQSNQNLS